MESPTENIKDEVDGSSVFPERRSDLFLLPCGDDLMIHDGDGKQVHCLNEIAGLVIKHCDGTASVGGLVTALQEEYRVTEEVLLQDINKILRDFRNHRLLT